MANTNFTEFDIFKEIKSLESFCPIEFRNDEKEIIVFAKKAPIKQSLIDILQNAKNYSADGSCKILMELKSNYVQLVIENNCSKIIPNERYELLGEQWLTNKDRGPGSGPGSGPGPVDRARADWRYLLRRAAWFSHPGERRAGGLQHLQVL